MREHKKITDNENINQADMQSGGDIPGESLFAIVMKRHWVVLIAVVVCVLSAIGYLVKATPIYSSSSRIYVEQAGPRIMTEQLGVMTQSKNYLFTQSSLISSTPIINAVIEKPDLARMSTFENVDHKLAFLKNKLDVSVGKKDDIIVVTMESPYPREAAQIVNAVVDAYITYHASQKKSTATEILKILQNEKVKRDKELTDKYSEILEFKTNNTEIALEDRQGNILLQSLSRLMSVLTDAKIETINARANYEATMAMKDDPEKLKQLIEAQRDSIYISFDQQETQLRNEKDRLQLQLTSLMQKVSADHPSVQSVQNKINQIDGKLDVMQADVSQAYLEVAKQDYEAAKQREVEFQKEVDKQKSEAEKINTKSAELAILNSELGRIESLCDILDSRIKELNVTEDVGALNISILEVAQPEDSPVKPQRNRIMAMALVLGLTLGVGLALLLDMMDHRLRNVEEISAILGVPILGVVPHMKKLKSISSRGLQVHNAPMSQISEAYKTIRTAVYFGVPEGKAKTILVTSPSPGDGKSTMISNLACAMAQAGQKTLIIDCDFRKPMQHNIFGQEQEPGLSSVLTGQDNIGNVITHTDIDHLDLIPCGPIPVNPSELLNSDAFIEILKGLSERYDRILIDSPPVMAVTDSRILATMCDVTLLVLRADKTTRKASEQARYGLMSVGANVLGAVVNDVPKGKGRYGYGYGYGYSEYGSYGFDYKQSSSPSTKAVKKDSSPVKTPKYEEVKNKKRFY